MSIKNANASRGILDSIQRKKEAVKEEISTIEKVQEETKEEVILNDEAAVIEGNIDILQQSKALIEEGGLIRRTFTIESLTSTQLDELKVYILPATIQSVNGQKKWGYNNIVNLAIKQLYERQVAELQSKLKK